MKSSRATSTLLFIALLLSSCTKPPPETTVTAEDKEPTVAPVPDYAKLPLPAALEEADLQGSEAIEIDFAEYQDFQHVSVRSGDQIVSATGRPESGWVAAPPLIIDVTIPESLDHAHVHAVEVVDGGLEGTFSAAEVTLITEETSEWHVPTGLKTSNWKEDLAGGRKGTVYAFAFGHEHPVRVRVTISQGSIYSPNQIHVQNLRVLGDYEK